MCADEALVLQERLHGAPWCARLLPRKLKALCCCLAGEARHHTHVLPRAVPLRGLGAANAIVALEAGSRVHSVTNVRASWRDQASQQVAARHLTNA